MKKLKFARSLCLFTVILLCGNVAAFTTFKSAEITFQNAKSNLVLESKKSVDSQTFEIEELEVEDESEDLDDIPIVDLPYFNIFQVQLFQIKRTSIFRGSKDLRNNKVPHWLLNRCIRI